MPGISEIIDSVLSEDTGEGSRREQIFRAVADKAANGDINAVKFLRELEAVGERDKVCEIRVSVIE